MDYHRYSIHSQLFDFLPALERSISHAAIAVFTINSATHSVVAELKLCVSPSGFIHLEFFSTKLIFFTNWLSLPIASFQSLARCNPRRIKAAIQSLHLLKD